MRDGEDGMRSWDGKTQKGTTNEKGTALPSYLLTQTLIYLREKFEVQLSKVIGFDSFRAIS